MNLFKLKILGLFLGTALLSGCAGGYSNEELGTVLGAGSGALIGSSITNDATGAVIGAGAGALIGHEVGRQTDDHYRYEGYRYHNRYGDPDGYRYGY